MYLKYALSGKRDRIGWNYIFDIDEAKAQHLELKESELDRWFGSCIAECGKIKMRDDGIKFDMPDDWIGKSLPFLYITVRKNKEHYAHILIDTEAFICTNDGETAQRLF